MYWDGSFKDEVARITAEKYITLQEGQGGALLTFCCKWNVCPSRVVSETKENKKCIKKEVLLSNKSKKNSHWIALENVASNW